RTKLERGHSFCFVPPRRPNWATPLGPPNRELGLSDRTKGDAMLTRKQRELLQFIQERLADTGISPSFDEMKDALGLKSKSGVHRLITGLEERGFIRRLPHRARA